MGKLEYLLGNHKKALEILKEIPIKDDFLLVLNIDIYYYIYNFLFFFLYRETGECSSVLINNNVGCLYQYAEKPTLAFTSISKAIVQHQKNILDVTKSNPGNFVH